MAQWLRTPVALAEDLDSVPRTHVGTHNYNSSSRESEASAGPEDRESLGIKTPSQLSLSLAVADSV